MKWQPIGTAPDGKTIILYTPLRGFGVGYREKDKFYMINNGDYSEGGYGRDYLCDGHGYYDPPTHWLLPESPK